MGTMDTVWDGVGFRQVESKEAKKLEKADKVQILSDGFLDGLSLKYRHEFTGYKTREVRAETAKVVTKPSKPEPDEAPEVDWKDHRRDAAKALGKPFNKTTKAETLKYIEDKEG